MINLKPFSKSIDWDALYFEAFDKDLCFYDLTKEDLYDYGDEDNQDKKFNLDQYQEGVKLLMLLKEQSVFNSKKIENNFRKMGWQLFGTGCSRATYGHEKRKVVIKVPLSVKGAIDNLCENNIASEDKNIFASSYLTESLWQVMPLLNTGYDLSIENDSHNLWVNSLSDGIQVGLNSNGKLKAYDYAHNHWGFSWSRKKI